MDVVEVWGRYARARNRAADLLQGFQIGINEASEALLGLEMVALWRVVASTTAVVNNDAWRQMIEFTEGWNEGGKPMRAKK